MPTTQRLLLLLKNQLPVSFFRVSPTGPTSQRGSINLVFIFIHDRVYTFPLTRCREHFAPLSRATLIYNFVVFFTARVGDYANIVFTEGALSIFVVQSHPLRHSSFFPSFFHQQNFQILHQMSHLRHLLIQIFNLHFLKSTMQQVDRKRGARRLIVALSKSSRDVLGLFLSFQDGSCF